jgi:glycosyltransferase involved in cell wall biosynthesis
MVLHVRVITEAGGGPDKTILNSPRFLRAAGYRMLCCYMHPPGDRVMDVLREKARKWQAPLIGIEDRGPWDWQIVFQLLHICRRERVTIWHGHDYKSNALGLVLRRFWPMRLITTVHGWVKHTRRTPLYYWVDRLCLPYFEKVICVSRDLLDTCLSAGVPADRCVVIENAIDTVEFARRQDHAAAKKLCGLSPERLVVGAVGRLSAEKGFDLLIRAANRLYQRGLDFDVIIIGDGEERPRLETLIQDNGDKHRIHLMGYQADVRRLYEAMDVFALSSLREGLPNVLLEAMALEVPVLATPIAGIPELVQDGVNGLLAEPGSVEALANRLEMLLQDAHLRGRFGRAGRDTIEARYSFAARMRKVQAVYENRPF